MPNMPNPSAVALSKKLLLCVSLALFLRSIPWTEAPYGGGWNAPQTLEADQGLLRVEDED